MKETKNRRESKTLQGAIVTIIGFVATQIGLIVDMPEVVNFVSALFVVIGVIMTITGRYLAEKKIK